MSRDYSSPPLASQTSGLEIGTLLVSALPDVWRYSVSAKASSPGVSNVCLSVAAPQTVEANPFVRCTLNAAGK